MRCATYCRISTEDQCLENQQREIQPWADREGHTIVARYSDVISGARRRESLDDLFDAARRRKFDLVAIWSLDRLTREGPLATLLYIHRLNALGVRVYSHQEPYLDPKLPILPGGNDYGGPSAQKRVCAGLSHRVRVWAVPEDGKTLEKGWSGGIGRGSYLVQGFENVPFFQLEEGDFEILLCPYLAGGLTITIVSTTL